MLKFLVRRLATMVLTALCLTLIVFYLTNLPPNLEKLAKSEAGSRISDAEVASWLEKNGHASPLLVRYGEWLGVVPGWTHEDGGVTTGRCIERGQDPATARRYCGVLQGDWGFSSVFKDNVSSIIATRLGLTGLLMFWVMAVMVPVSLLIGVLAGMREGSKLDRSLSTFSIATTATPEYVSGVILIAAFATSMGWKVFKGTATSAMDEITFENFFLPVMTIALYGIGYIARMTRASMTEVMTAQYIRTARLKGASFGNIVVKHALRNALIPVVTIIGLQLGTIISGSVVVETVFSWPGVGTLIISAAKMRDYPIILYGVMWISVAVTFMNMLVDISYSLLDPRIRDNA